MSHQPPGAPPCWSRQYDDADAECSQCAYKTTCRASFLRNNNMAPPAPAQQFAPSWSTPTAPRVQLPTYQPRQVQTMAPAPAVPPVPARTQDFSQYYAPHEGERTLHRVAKHIVLKLLEVVFSELANFFRLWRWPPAARMMA